MWVKVKLSLSVGLLALSANLFAEAGWTRGVYDSTGWKQPDDALTGNSNLNAYSNFSVSDSFGNGSANETWAFQEPKNLSSVSILMNSVSYNVAALYVRYAGEDTNYYAIANADYDMHTDVSKKTKLTWSDPNGHFAENVTGFKIAITNMYPFWANHQEILVCGDTAGSDCRWKFGRLASIDDYAPAADCLPGLVAPEDYPSWNSYGKYVNDGNLTNTWYSRGSLEWNFDTPKRIRRVAVYGSKDSGGSVKMTGIYVKHTGDTEYSLVKGTSLDTFNGGTGPFMAELVSDDGFIATDVISVKFAANTPEWRLGLGEAEVDGEDSFLSSLTADYSIGGGKLNTTLTPEASSFPKQVYLCCGDADGGKDVEAWDRVVPAVAVVDRSPIVDSRVVDFKFCRYYFKDVDNDAWSDAFALSIEPAGSAAVVSVGRNDAEVSISVSKCGGTNEVVDVYFAYAPVDDELPAYSLLESGVAQGESVTAHLTGLLELTNYNFSVRIVNVDGGVALIPGDFATLGFCYWEKSSYNPSMEWVKPSDRFPCGGSEMYDDNLGSRVIYQSGNTTVISWAEPKDISQIDIYVNGSGDWRCEIKQVELICGTVTNVLSGSYLNYSESVSNQKLAILRAVDGLLGTGVTKLRIVNGTWLNTHAHGIAELVVHGKTTDSQVRWDYAKVSTADELTHPSDVLTNDLVQLVNFVALEHDDVLGAYSERYNGQTWIWNFSKPHNIRTVELWTYGYAARSPFRIDSVQYKLKGEGEYRTLIGSSLDLFNYGTAGHRAILQCQNGKWILKDVIFLKLILGQPNNAFVTVGEVRCTGERSVKGIKIVLR